MTTHVSSASDQFLNMTALALDSVPGLEPTRFVDKTQIISEKIEEMEVANESLKAPPVALEPEQKKDFSTRESVETDDQSIHLANSDSSSSNSNDTPIIDDGKRERKLLMGEMLKVSLDQPNCHAIPFVCG